MPQPTSTALALCAALIADEEGFVAHPYWDNAGKVWSQGFGFCTLADGSPVTQHSPIMTLAECRALLASKLAADYMPAVIRLCDPATDGQVAALGSLCWNIGQGALANSMIPRLARAKAWSGVVAAMQQYVHAHGVVIPDLVGRRKREGAVLLGATFLPGKKTGQPLGTPVAQPPNQPYSRPQVSQSSDQAATAALNDASLAAARNQ